VEHRALKEIELLRSPRTDDEPSKFVIRYPGPPGAHHPISIPLGADRDDQLGQVPANMLSELIRTEAGDWKGAAKVYAELTLWDALGVDAAERGERLERRVEDVVREYAKARVAWLQQAARPLTDARPLSDVDPKVPGLTEILTLEGRAPLTAEGRAVRAAFATALQALNREPERAGEEAQQVEVGGATLSLIWQRHGLRLAQLSEAYEAIPAYLACERPIHTCAEPAAAWEIERVARRLGQLRHGRLLDAGILRLLRDPELLRAIAVLVATASFPRVGEAALGKAPEFELQWTVDDVVRRERFGPADDITGLFVECMRRRDDVREPIVAWADEIWRDLLAKRELDGTLDYLEAALIRLDFGPARRDVDAEQLRLTLCILLRTGHRRSGGGPTVIVPHAPRQPNPGGNHGGKLTEALSR
jgi:hypothetical protein